MSNHVTVASRRTEIWPFEFHEILTLCEVQTLVIAFLQKKFQNRAPKRCRPGVVLSPATISFELHAKVAEEIELEMCSCGQLSEVQMVCDLDLTLDRVKVTSTCAVRVGLLAWKTM